MTLETAQLSKVGKTEKRTSKSPNSRKYSEVRTREYLLSAEIEAMRSAVKKGKGRHNIQHTVRYTELASTKFQGLWDG